jgi:hypothetical protein
MYDYFFSLDGKSDFEVVESNLPAFSTTTQRNRYLKSFIDMAKKGLYSYDAGDGFYKLIVRPKETRGCSELPAGIQDVLCVLSLASSGDVNNIKNFDFRAEAK